MVSEFASSVQQMLSHGDEVSETARGHFCFYSVSWRLTHPSWMLGTKECFIYMWNKIRRRKRGNTDPQTCAMWSGYSPEGEMFKAHLTHSEVTAKWSNWWKRRWEEIWGLRMDKVSALLLHQLMLEFHTSSFVSLRCIDSLGSLNCFCNCSLPLTENLTNLQ